MADKKIINLPDIQSQDLDGFYVPGSKEVSGVYSSKKFNLGSFKESINNISNYITYGIEEFNDQKNYYTGEYVIYDNNIYRFTTYHQAGEWNHEDVDQVSAFDQLKTNLNEFVYIRIKSSDGNLDVSGIQVTVSIPEGQQSSISVTSDEYGNCMFTVPKNKEYTLSFETKAGYQEVENITLTAEYEYRYINVVYQKSITGSCNLNVNFELNPFCGGNISDFNNYTCTLKSGETTIDTKTINNGVARFTGLEKGNTYTVIIPDVLNYVRPTDPEKSGTIYSSDNTTILSNYMDPQPLNKTFQALDDEIEINTIYKHIYQDYGLYLVYTTVIDEGEENEKITYNEILLDQLFTDNDYVNGTWIGDELGITKDNAIAVHVYPEELATKGCDYYFKIEDSVTNYGSYVFCDMPRKKIIPNVPCPKTKNDLLNNYFDGKLYTYYIITEAYGGSTVYTSPAINFITQKTFEYKGTVLRGFLGSLSQLKYILESQYPENTSILRKVYQNLEYTSSEIDVFITSKANAMTSVLAWISATRIDKISINSTLASGDKNTYGNIGTPFFSV